MTEAGGASIPLLQQKLDDYCKSLSRSGCLNGCVLVASEGQIVLCKGFGMASFEHGIPNTPQTIFRIGSMTKQFTAMAVVMMHERKLLNVNDPIARYIPGFPNGDTITVHHLLTNTSGIPNFNSFEDGVRPASSMEETIAKFSDKSLLFEPGERFDNSHSGYLLLSYIIERITNRAYEDYIHHAILKPFGLINSGYYNAHQILKNRASGYDVCDGRVYAELTDMPIPSGAGGLYSTIEDLYIWGLALHSRLHISEQAYERMTTPFRDQYGYGLFIYEEEILGSSRKVIGHSGGMNGFVSEMKHYKNEDLTVIVLSNLAATQVGPISQQLARIAFGEEVEYSALHEAERTAELFGDTEKAMGSVGL